MFKIIKMEEFLLLRNIEDYKQYMLENNITNEELETYLELIDPRQISLKLKEIYMLNACCFEYTGIIYKFADPKNMSEDQYYECIEKFSNETCYYPKTMLEFVVVLLDKFSLNNVVRILRKMFQSRIDCAECFVIQIDSISYKSEYVNMKHFESLNTIKKVANFEINFYDTDYDIANLYNSLQL